MTRKIPATGINLFQLIYVLIREYKERTGQEPLNLSLGNPDTVPNPDIRALQARFAQDPTFAFHTYGEDKNLHEFVEGMVELHGHIRFRDHEHLDAVPIAGIKTASTYIPLACGLHLPDSERRRSFRVASNLPAYDVIGTWSRAYLGANRIVWPLAPEDDMRLSVRRLEAALDRAGVDRVDVIFVIRPGNPAAVGSHRDEWKQLIEHCIERDTRLVNDAAYAGLAGDHHTPLAQVAVEYPELEWAELYSVSKSFSNPGARLGALVGSRDFVADFRVIKGNADSGTTPFVMAAYGTYFQDQARARAALAEMRSMYQRRVAYLVEKLQQAGMRLACHTDAGFFTLWQTPRRVLGVDLATDPRTRDMPISEAFNRIVISETGIVGVHFEGPPVDGRAYPLTRYAVCTDVLDPGFQSRFEDQLARLQPEY